AGRDRGRRGQSRGAIRSAPGKAKLQALRLYWEHASDNYRSKQGRTCRIGIKLRRDRAVERDIPLTPNPFPSLWGEGEPYKTLRPDRLQRGREWHACRTIGLAECLWGMPGHYEKWGCK